LPGNIDNLEFLSAKLESLVIGSASSSTWNKHNSALNSYMLFHREFCNDNPWPVSIEKIRAYAVWALTVRKLKPATVNSYISSIQKSHVLKGLQVVNFCEDKIVKMAIAGAENCLVSYNKCKISVNPPMMRILCHKIAQCSWSEYSKQVVWSCFLLAFFTSCRMGEITSADANCFDPKTDFVWQNVKLMSDSSGAIVFLPFTKSKKFAGDFLDIFFFNIPAFCPVVNLFKLEKMQKELGIYNIDEPVFKFKSGLLLTKLKINDILKCFLKDIDSSNTVTAHSFRSSIPTLIAEDSLNINGRVKTWGRWSSESYKVYTKNVRVERFNIYLDVCEKLYSYWK